MSDKRVCTLVPLLLLAVGVSCSEPQSGPLAAMTHTMNEVVRPFLTDAWPFNAQSDDVEVRRPGEESPEVNVAGLGVTFKGTTTWTLNNRTVNSFLGIRFAKFIGRFKYSEEVTKDDYSPVDGTVSAEHYGPKCAQKSGFGDFAGGAEDCFFLNVYVPADLQDASDLPVMVFIHGGSFTSGDSSLYLPTRLLDEDVILVVIQYRLGALGWLSLLNAEMPGNAGLSDQLNALRWVKNYISSFGGNPDMVTVFGQSAGSVSVSMIVTVADPEEKLFAGAIAESGSAFEYWAIDEHPVQSAMDFAEFCGCTDYSNEAAVYSCLTDEKTTADDIAVCTSGFVREQRLNAQLGFDGTSPVVQGNETWALIKWAPIDYVEQGLANDVPFLSGCVRDEGSFVFAVMTEDYLRPNDLMDNGEYLANEAIPDLLSAAGIDDSTRAFSKGLEDKFLPGVDMTSYDDMAPGMIDMSGMLFLKSGTYNYARLHSLIYTQATFYYSFDFESQNSLFDLAYLGSDPPFEGGITHADELMYLFAMPSALDDSQRLTSRRLVRLWTNFAKTGNPTPDGKITDLGLPAWTPMTADGMNYLLIQDEVTVENYYPDRYTIRMDMERGTTSPTEEPTDPPKTVSQEEYDDLQKESDAFMACMIVFIVLFVISTGAAVFFYLKTR